MRSKTEHELEDDRIVEYDLGLAYVAPSRRGFARLPHDDLVRSTAITLEEYRAIEGHHEG